jgi:hypothetical protein
MTLLPQRKSGFVVLINADAEDARTVLTEMLTKHFTAPNMPRTVASYADELENESRQRHASHVPDTSSRKPAAPADIGAQLGLWRDPWFGEARICVQDGIVRFASSKSPRLTGQVMRVGDRYLVHWDHDDVEAWLRFPAHSDGKLHMAKVDPDADFSSDYEDLSFTREHACN